MQPLSQSELNNVARTRLFDPVKNISMKLEGDGSMPVTLQDSTTPSIISYAHLVSNTTVLSIATAKDDREITVDDPTGIVIANNANNYIHIFDLEANTFFIGFITNVAGNVLTVDTLINEVFPAGSLVSISTHNMAVNGAITPKVFTLRGADPGIDLSVDITRFMMYCITTAAVNLTDFGDIANGLTNGLMIRKVDGTTTNLINYHSNIEMKGLMYDWQSLADSNPGQGLNGFTGRFTVSKLGSVMRISPGESVEFIVQDDCSSLLGLYIIPEGSIVTP